MPMFMIQFQAIPKADSPEAQEVGGAFVNCWIEAPDLDAAVGKAKHEITDQGWEPLELRQAEETTRDDYTDDHEGLEYFEQALIDKEVCVFHCYPIEDEPD